MAFCLTLIAASSAWADVRIAIYNLLFYDSSSSSRHPSYVVVTSMLNPDIICVQEIANLNAVNQFLSGVLNAPGGPGDGDPFVAASFTDSAQNLDVALYYRPSRFSEIPAGYLVIPSASPRDSFRWRLRPVEDDSGANDIYLYGMHLSAGNAGERENQATAIRSNANGLAAGTHFVFLGDMNLQSSSEAAYQQFVGSQADNDGRAFDPLNPNNVLQSWSGNGSFASMHTQSPHQDNNGSPSGGVGGGMDDRFDLLLFSYSLIDGAGAEYVPGSYRAFGNDGQHFNDDINDPPTIPEGAAVANALHAASDHLPVYFDVELNINVPPTISAPGFLNLGLVMVGGTTSAPLTVQNTALPQGQDLEYTFSAPVNFEAPAGQFILAPGDSAQHTISATGVSVPIQSGTLVINNNSDNAPVRNVLVACEVRNHAIPSTVADSQVTSSAIDFGEHEAGQFIDMAARVYNANYVANSSVPLDVYDANFTGDDASRFVLVGFSPTPGITSFADFDVQFDDELATPGTYSAVLNLLTRDDTALNGATDLATISYSLSATVINPGQVPGDFDQDGVVDLDDVDAMIAVLLDPDGAGSMHRSIGDMNGDDSNNGLDLPLFVDAMLAP